MNEGHLFFVFDENDKIITGRAEINDFDAVLTANIP